MSTIERCEICGHHRGGQLVTITTRDNEEHTLCEKCARDNFIRAYDGSWHDLRPYRIDLQPLNRQTTDFYDGPFTFYRYGKFIPRLDWYEYRMRFCEHCGGVEQRADMRTVHDYNCHTYETEEKLVCRSCSNEFLDGDYYFCEDCEEIHHVDNMYWSAGVEGWVCHSCYDSDYATCDHCGEIYRSSGMYSNEYTDGIYCEYCWNHNVDRDDPDDEDNEPGDMHSYGYTPDELMFYKTKADIDWASRQRQAGKPYGQLFMGVELEFSHYDNDDRFEHSNYIQRHYNEDCDSHFYQKSDSSLSYGIEQVSHPMTLNYWLDEMRGVMSSGLDSARKYINEGDSDGYHIHISRKGMNLSHRIKFGAFFELCREQIELVARRKNNGYAQFLSRSETEIILNPKHLIQALVCNRGNRYRCVNWNNVKTAEVRVFKSTTNTYEFYGALELVHGVYQFTKSVPWKKMFYAGQCGVLWDWFLDFMAQDKRYLDLFNLLDSLAEQTERNADWGSTVISDELDFFFGISSCDRWSTPAAVVINSIERRTREAA